MLNKQTSTHKVHPGVRSSDAPLRGVGRGGQLLPKTKPLKSWVKPYLSTIIPLNPQPSGQTGALYQRLSNADILT